MTLWDMPWLELAVLVPLVGAAVALFLRRPERAFGWTLGVTGTALAFAVIAWLDVHFDQSTTADEWLHRVGISSHLEIDGLSAPLVPIVALLHFLTVLTTSRSRLPSFPFTALLASEAVRLAAFSCREPWPLIALFGVCALPPLLELRSRRAATRLYLLHMTLFVGLLVLGWAFIDATWASIPLLAAVLVRCGTVPVHTWVPDLLAKNSFGGTLVVLTPLLGVYAAVRLVIPVAPSWVLEGIGWASLGTAIYAAGLSLIQTEARRFFAFQFLSHASLVLVGLQLHTVESLTAALGLWFSAMLSLGGLGLCLRALEARFGPLRLDRFNGLYDQSPALAVCFLITGLAVVGFPGTAGFVSAELLVNGAIEANPWIGLGVVIASALNGIAIVRAYFALFTGTRHPSTLPLGITPRERIAFAALIALILAAGLVPGPGMKSRFAAAERLLADRAARVGTE